MKRIVATTALACVLALSGCSGASSEQPTPSASGSQMPTDPATSIVPPARIPSTPPEPSSASPTADSTTVSTEAYCETVQGYQQEAKEAISDLPKEPQSLRANLAKLQGAREQLREAEASAPESLKKSVADQADALDELVAQARSGDLKSINTDKYTEAARDFVQQCDLAS